MYINVLKFISNLKHFFNNVLLDKTVFFVLSYIKYL